MAKEKPKVGECECRCGSGPAKIVGLIVALLLVPILFIWSLHMLFSLAIAYNPFTWFAALILVTIIGRGGRFWHHRNWCICCMYGCMGHCSISK